MVWYSTKPTRKPPFPNPDPADDDLHVNAEGLDAERTVVAGVDDLGADHRTRLSACRHAHRPWSRRADFRCGSLKSA